MKLRAGIIFTPDKTDTHLEAKPYLRFQRKQRGQPGPEQQQGKIGFFRTKLWAARIVERWEEDYGELDPEERDRKGGHLWWWTPPADEVDQ